MKIKYIIIMCILIVSLVGCDTLRKFYGIEPPQERTLEEKYYDLLQKRAEIKYELWMVNQIIAMYEMDLEAKEKNLTVEYKKLPDSDMVVRIEYNGSVYEGIDIGEELIENMEVTVNQP